MGKMGVLTAEECAARQDVIHDHYSGTVEMEALTLIDMINQHVIPSVKAAGVGSLSDLQGAVKTIQDSISEIHTTDGTYDKAKLARVLRLETMIDVREVCDAAEGAVPANLWTLATYKELLFMDSHVGPGLEEVYEE